VASPRLEYVVQQQRGHIEHLMQKLQDVTVTLDNNWDNKKRRFLLLISQNVLLQKLSCFQLLL